jgi:hypothetical protein
VFSPSPTLPIFLGDEGGSLEGQVQEENPEKIKGKAG